MNCSDTKPCVKSLDVHVTAYRNRLLTEHHAILAAPPPLAPKSKLQTRSKAPERRCSSRTFRYGYLVTT